MKLSPAQMQRLHDGNVILKPLEPADVTDRYLSWLASDDVVRYLEVRFARRDRDSVVEFVRHCQESPTILFLGIHDAADGTHVGNIKLAWNPHHLAGDIGLMIGESSRWSRGLGTSSVKILTAFAFEELKLRKVIAGTYHSHVASIRTFEKSGYTLENTLRRQALLDGVPIDVLQFVKFRDSATT
ncbi:MAG TPA: GNAT family protein [Burkholderiaceae bacterium]